MRRISLPGWLFVVSLFFLTSLTFAQSNPCSVIDLGPGGSFHGFVPFPPSSLWNTNIANAPVDPNSANYINFIGGGVGLHADFGAGLYDGQTIGIPYIVVPGTQRFVNINYT